jgi:hypothetical protein
MLDVLDERLHIPKLDLLLWVFLAGVCGAAIFGSVKASKAFAKKYDANVKQIVAAETKLAKAAKADASGVRPNAALIKEVDSRREGMDKQLLQVWQTLYDRQAKFLVWPKESGIGLSAEGKGAAEAGKAAAGKKKKPEGKAKKEDAISPEACKLYNERVVRSEFERVFSKLDLRRPKAGHQPSLLENLPFKDRPADFDGLVAWDPQQREAIISRHHLAQGVPSSARVKLVQEDLWIFESLIDAIGTLNHNAKDALSAPVKQIEVLDVAQWATAARRQQAPAMWAPEPSGGAKPAPPAAKPQAPPGEKATDEALADGRYLDEKGQPLSGGAKQPFEEFKQIFVYMKLVVDQRRTADLLAALANAPLPVEVRHFAVQLLPDSTVREATVPAQEVAEGGEAAGDVAAAASTPVLIPTADVPIGSLSVAETTAWDAVVEVGGVIYLYNQPNVKKLGSGAAKSPAARSFRTPPGAAVVPAK